MCIIQQKMNSTIVRDDIRALVRAGIVVKLVVVVDTAAGSIRSKFPSVTLQRNEAR